MPLLTLNVLGSRDTNDLIFDGFINQPDFIYVAALRLDKMTITYK